MSARRSWMGRLSGGRTASATQPPPQSHPEPGPRRPFRAGPPERNPGLGPPTDSPAPEPQGPALRVVLVSRDGMLAGALRSLVDAPDGVRILDWHSDELGSAVRDADVVIVDMPPSFHQRTFAAIDDRFSGRSVVLLQEGEHAGTVPPGPARVVLYRPLQIGEIWAAMTSPLPAAPSDTAAREEPGHDRPPDDAGPQAEVPPAPEVEATGGPEAEVPEIPDVPEVEAVPEAEVPAAAGVEPDPVAPAAVEPEAAVGSDRPEPAPGPAVPQEPEPEAAAGVSEPTGGSADDNQVVEEPDQGLPVAESGRMIGLSGQELDPVIGPGQVAPGMDEATLERLHRWGTRSGPSNASQADQARPGRRRTSGTRDQADRARAEARREQARQEKAARSAAQRTARAEAARERAARAEARRIARKTSRQARLARAQARRDGREESGRRNAVRAAARREESRQAKAARAAAGKEARADAAQAKTARAEERKAARAEAAQARAARAEGRRAERAEARQARASKAGARQAARAEARQARAAARQKARADAAQARAARAGAGRAARAETKSARAVRREEARQARLDKAETRRATRAEARTARSSRAEVRRAESQQARATRAEERKAARAEAAQARRVARAEARGARTTRREQARQARSAKAEARGAARAEAKDARATRAEVRREQASQARTARSEARQVARAEAAQARAAKAEARQAARAEARQARAAKAEDRRVARAEAKAARAAGRVEARQATVARAGGWRVARVVVVVVLLAAVGLGAAGWREGGGPDTLAGEVAAVRASGAGDGGLVVQDPRIGPVEPLHALAVGAWLRASGPEASLESTVRAARAASRFLLAGAVALAVLLALLLMRVGPGTGAAAGPGPAPPQGQSRPVWQLGLAALAGLLVALDPSLLAGGRVATGTVLAVVAGLGTLALAWALPDRPTLRWLPAVAAGSGLALLVSPLTLPVLVVPAVAALLERRSRQLWRALAALGLGAGLWLVLPIWVAGQDLAAAQAGWLLGRPPGRGSLAASLAASPLSWLLVAAGLVAALLSWRHRSGARPATGAARMLAWAATTAVGALVAVGVGYPASQALPFAVPAAAVALALAAGRAATAVRGGAGTRRIVLAGVGVALAGLVAAQAVDGASRYGTRPDDALGRLVATVAAEVPACAAVNAAGPDDRARLLAAGVTVTDFADATAARAAGVRYFVLTGDPGGRGGRVTPALASWVRQHGSRLALHPSPSLSGVELWRVSAAPLDPVADSLPVPGGVFANVAGSACGGYRVVDNQAGAFHTAYQATGGRAVLGRPLGSVWTSDGPALQAFDTMVLGAAPAASGQPGVRPIELPPLLAKLNAEAVADADIPLPSARPPVTDQQAQTLLDDRVIARAYLGTDPATASADDWRRARDRFGRPLGLPQVMPDGAVRQPFERVVLELPADGGPVRPAALGRLAVRLGLVPERATKLEPSPGPSAPLAETRLDTGPLLRLLAGLAAVLALAAGAGALAARRGASTHTGQAVAGR